MQKISWKRKLWLVPLLDVAERTFHLEDQGSTTDTSPPSDEEGSGSENNLAVITEAKLSLEETVALIATDSPSLNNIAGPSATHTADEEDEGDDVVLVKRQMKNTVVAVTTAAQEETKMADEPAADTESTAAPSAGSGAPIPRPTDQADPRIPRVQARPMSAL